MKAYWDEDLDILSAENVTFAVETAGMGSRLTAVVIDMMIQAMLMVGISFFFTFVSVALASSSIGLLLASFSIGFLWIAIFAIFYAYFFLFEWRWSGQTPGKRIVGLRVMQANGLPVTWWPAMVRNVLRIVDFLPVGYGVGGAAAILGRHNQRVGDMVAGTIVAREQRDADAKPVLGISAAVDAFLTARQTPQQIETLDTNENLALPADAHNAGLRLKLSAEDAELAREFLRRRDAMPATVRARLALSLTHRLSNKLGRTPPAEPTNESLLEEVGAAFGQI